MKDGIWGILLSTSRYERIHEFRMIGHNLSQMHQQFERFVAAFMFVDFEHDHRGIPSVREAWRVEAIGARAALAADTKCWCVSSPARATFFAECFEAFLGLSGEECLDAGLRFGLEALFIFVEQAEDA